MVLSSVIEVDETLRQVGVHQLLNPGGCRNLEQPLKGLKGPGPWPN